MTSQSSQGIPQIFIPPEPDSGNPDLMSYIDHAVPDPQAIPVCNDDLHQALPAPSPAATAEVSDPTGKDLSMDTAKMQSALLEALSLVSSPDIDSPNIDEVFGTADANDGAAKPLSPETVDYASKDGTAIRFGNVQTFQNTHVDVSI